MEEQNSMARVKICYSLLLFLTFFASRPSVWRWMRYQLWISTNDAFHTGLLQISCIISKDNANRNTLKLQKWGTWYFLQNSYERKSVVWRNKILWPG
jgi:hypothetical protein